MDDLTPPDTPVCDKLRASRGEVETIRRFLEFLDDKHLQIAALDGNGDLYPCLPSFEELIHEHLGIDRQALETERRALLEYQRTITEKGDRP